MKINLLSIFKFVVLLTLVVSFIISVSIGIFVWKYPENAGGLISTLIPTPAHSPVKIKGLAVMGDSQSDEYQADDKRGGIFYENTFNWVELLAKYRKLNFGKWGNYPETRRVGYEFNWARTGATTYSMLLSGQSEGIAEQVRQGKVNVVILDIGANDYSPFIDKDGYRQIYDGTLNEADIIKKENDIVANITSAVEIIKSAGKVNFILVKIPDWGKHIGIRLAFPFPDRRDRVSLSIIRVNNKLLSLANQNGMSVVDPDLVYSGIIDGGLRVGDYKMQLLLLNNDPKNLFLDDGIHAGTVLNGLFANQIIKALNSIGTPSIDYFSNKELLQNAGIIN